jgi:hypothetical protein
MQIMSLRHVRRLITPFVKSHSFSRATRGCLAVVQLVGEYSERGDGVRVKLTNAPRLTSLCLDNDIEALHWSWPMTIYHEKHRSKRREIAMLDQHGLVRGLMARPDYLDASGRKLR